MEPARTIFADQTFRYTQLVRSGMVALYEQQHKQGGSPRFEVVILRHMPAKTYPNGVVLPEREAYPSTREWGTYGWTFHTRPEAERWMAHLQEVRP